MFVPVVREVMSRPVETISGTETVRAAARRLHTLAVGSLVIAEDGRPVGVITSSDIVGLFAAGGDGDAVVVEDVMTVDPVTIGPEAPVTVAAERFAEHDVETLPVVADGTLVGVVATSDIAAYVATGAMQATEPAEPQRHRYRPDTAYEDEDWSVQSYGTEDGLDVGDRVTFTKTLSEADVEAFAEASGDTNRLHLDEAFAAETRFGRRIAHGALVTGVISGALARLPGLIIYLSQQVTFTGPVDIGERVTARCSVVASLDRDRYRLSTTVETDAGEHVLEGEATVLADPLPDV